MKKPALLILVSVLALCLTLGVYHIVKNRPAPPPPDVPPESYTPAPTSPLAVVDKLDPAAYPAGTTVGDWLLLCESPDRDEQLNAYILSHTATAGDKTTYTYFILYRHGESGLGAAASLYEGESGSRRIDVTYTSAEAREGASLTYLQVTLPAGKEPRVRLIGTDGESVGTLVTVSGTPLEK